MESSLPVKQDRVYKIPARSSWVGLPWLPEALCSSSSRVQPSSGVPQGAAPDLPAPAGLSCAGVPQLPGHSWAGALTVRSARSVHRAGADIPSSALEGAGHRVFTPPGSPPALGAPPPSACNPPSRRLCNGLPVDPVMPL